jgi:hypothetical protein
VIFLSRGSTKRQKIDKSISFLFKGSERLSLKYEKVMVFHYVEGVCHLILEHHIPAKEFRFDNEIELLEEALKNETGVIFRKNRDVIDYYECLQKVNEMIKRKYGDTGHNPLDSLRVSLIEMKLMRKCKLAKPSINEFLHELEKEGDMKIRELL